MKDSVVAKLALRETRGCLQPYLRGNRARFFKKCPERFCIPLDSILDVNGVLRKGHVILGFTKNGRYLISYRLKIDNDDTCPMPCYIYSLHWWEFHQWKPLVQVFSVALFDGEEIHEDLHLMVAESPDGSHVVVYGEVRPVKGDQSHQCYVTVCAGPLPRPCSICKDIPLGEIVERCLKHSFVLHFKYDLLPPFPLFNPSINLRVQDTVLFNTGDYLMALKIITSESTFSMNSAQDVSKSLYADKEYHVSKLCSSLHVESVQDASATNTDRGEVSTCKSCLASGEVHGGEPSAKDMDVTSNQEVDLTTSSEIATGVNSSSAAKAEGTNSSCATHKNVDRCKVVSAFVNGLKKIHGEQTDAHEEQESLSLTWCTENEKKYQDLHNQELAAMKCHSEGRTQDKSFNITGLSSDAVQTSESISIVNSSDSRHKAEHTSTGTCSNISDKENSSLPSTDSLESDNENCGLECYNRVSNTCSSCGCNLVTVTPILNNNNLTSSILKVYKQSSNVASYDELPDLANEFDMYDGSLPLKVKTSHGATLTQVSKINQSSPNAASNPFLEGTLGSGMQVLAIQQETLDVEQCIVELIQAHEDLKRNYKSLKDYDVQVVSVCPDSGEVITLARLLVYTRTRRQSATCGLSVSPSPVLQRTGFIFSWNVWNGAVRILQVLELEAYPERTRYSKFNMAAKEASEIRAKFSIPQGISSIVQAFSNHTVFTGKSLKYLRHPFLPLVLVL